MKKFNKFIYERLKLCSNDDLKNLLTERLKLNKQTQVFKDMYILCRPPLFNELIDDFREKFEDRHICIWCQATCSIWHMYLVTLNEVKNFWKNKVIECTLMPQKLDINASDKEIQEFINKYNRIAEKDWDPQFLKKYDPKNI